jgi:hypothetical protein
MTERRYLIVVEGGGSTNFSAYSPESTAESDSARGAVPTGG